MTMIIQVEVPQVGESITEGVLVEWLKRDGDRVVTDDPLFTLETDKVTMTINAEHAGTLKILVPAGQTVKIGQVVAEVDTQPTEASPQAVPQTPGPAFHPIAGAPQARNKLAQTDLAELAPSVRRLVQEHELDPKAIEATGRDGRITKGD
ncbi:MAG TPA: E3 binding domain-containing protein, partial [Polyangiaceae bacterium]|nr:E3 binding domain-containing protein [Polyangiaceae bacterium]